VIAGIDDKEFGNAVNMADASVNELSARVAQAERTFKRLNRLSRAGAASPEEMEQAETGLETLKAALTSARTRLGEARRILGESIIKAPFSGTVTDVFAEPGEWTGPGAPIVQLAGDGPVELRVEVPENTVTKLSIDQQVKVSLPYAEGKLVNGRIKYLARAASGEGRLFPVIISLEPDDQLFSGMTAELIIDIKAGDSIGVPVKSILNPGSSKPYIFCYKNRVVEKISVTLGALKGRKVIVKGNVSAGDLVVVAGHTMLSDGDRVEAHNE
jgi:RND family efflux transporter MFP subunit